VHEFFQRKENLAEKALIPLPPTGLVFLFCAKRVVVKTSLGSLSALGLGRGLVISPFAKF
jgi:hypothetical protein